MKAITIGGTATVTDEADASMSVGEIMDVNVIV